MWSNWACGTNWAQLWGHKVRAAHTALFGMWTNTKTPHLNLRGVTGSPHHPHVPLWRRQAHQFQTPDTPSQGNAIAADTCTRQSV